MANVLGELASRGRLIAIGRLYVHADTVQKTQKMLLERVGEVHRRQPESPGIRREQLLTDSGLRKEIFDGWSNGCSPASCALADRKGYLAVPAHREQFNDAERQLLQRVESMFKEHLFDPPSPQTVADQTRAVPAKVARAIRILVEQQRLIRVEQDLYFHADAVAEGRARLVRYIQEKGELESVQFKYVLDTTRKYAIPLLDYFILSK